MLHIWEFEFPHSQHENHVVVFLTDTNLNAFLQFPVNIIILVELTFKTKKGQAALSPKNKNEKHFRC